MSCSSWQPGIPAAWEQTPELADALRRLRLHKIEQDLDQIIADGVKDKDPSNSCYTYRRNCLASE
ncbi:MAG: hypothetical protein R3F38_10960 [Gammaproteobacteria bacterium]